MKISLLELFYDQVHKTAKLINKSYFYAKNTKSHKNYKKWKVREKENYNNNAKR